MKKIEEMTQVEVAAIVQTHLSKKGIKVILSGGAVAAHYSNGKYPSKDIDFVTEWQSQTAKEKIAMQEIGFSKRNKYFVHPDSEHIVEILSGPLTLGKQRFEKPVREKLSTGFLIMLSPTDSVKDRLAAYFYWKDTQAFETAIAIAKSHPLDYKDLDSWAIAEDMEEEYENFKNELDEISQN